MAALRRRNPWLDHLFRAAERYSERYGDHYAAAITYFSLLSLVPLLMVLFAVAGSVLASQPALLAQLRDEISTAVPGALGDEIGRTVNAALESRGTVGLLGLLAAVYSGLGWMSNLRDALTAQWGHAKQQLPVLRKAGRDLLALVGLGSALLVSFGLTAIGTGLGSLLLRWAGLADAGWAPALLWVAALVLSLAANWLVFLWVLAKLPREPVTWRSAARGAVAASLGFELLKQLGNIYLRSVLGSLAGATFGPIIGVLVFANLVARFLLFVTAWTATARENARLDQTSAAPTTVLRPVVQVRTGPRPSTALGLLGLGALAGLVLGRARAAGRAGRRRGPGDP
ncbi:membrane protein [Goodfellowiella coeruleoviolacea]|uniref:Membrane protein n=1 Tax=Goodfellowiella coeruleoviolacea TaxID=334858 RepID=A0AAE3GDS7_9PSEU|nr:inner membrane protein YhjD [Goodfellowiella coeruleoviolacea]MCP2165504.1 membrane protein [Goodfellowiella coeruleoviolacea]